jgi:hypothetical protein
LEEQVNKKLRIAGLTALIILVLFGLGVAFRLPFLPRGGESVAETVKHWFGAAPQPSLLITTDLDCDWKLDGKPQGHLRAKDSALLATVLGQHLVEGRTVDGKDEWRVIVELHTAEQHVAAIGLEAIRQKRLEEEKALEEKRVAEARRSAQEARQAEEKRLADARQAADAETLRQRRAAAELERKEAISRGWYVDPQSHLMWMQTDAQYVNWAKATTTCGPLRLGGFRDWRLPTIEELEGMHARMASFPPPAGRGSYFSPIDLYAGGSDWSATKDPYGKPWVYDRTLRDRTGLPELLTAHVLCVRSGE